MFSIPVVFLVGGDAPTRSMLRYLLEDDGAAVVEVAEPRALGSAPRPAALALLVLVTSAPEQDVSPLLVTLRRTGFHAPTLVLTRAGLERSDAVGPWLYSTAVRARMEAYTWR